MFCHQSHLAFPLHPICKLIQHPWGKSLFKSFLSAAYAGLAWLTSANTDPRPCHLSWDTAAQCHARLSPVPRRGPGHPMAQRYSEFCLSARGRVRACSHSSRGTEILFYSTACCNLKGLCSPLTHTKKKTLVNYSSQSACSKGK